MKINKIFNYGGKDVIGSYSAYLIKWKLDDIADDTFNTHILFYDNGVDFVFI